MPGFAETQFYTRGHSPPISESNCLLNQLQERGCLRLIDVKAALYLDQNADLEEEALLLFAFLFAASRHGHLCIEVDKTLHPSLKSIWQVDDKEEILSLENKIVRGFEQLSPTFLKGTPNLKRVGPRLYLQKNWAYESEIELHFKKIESDKPSLPIHFNSEEMPLTDEQSQAIKKSFNHSLSFISGGPGVGKTYTASLLIKAFLKQYPSSRIALVAPTGKAVANLQQYLMQSLGQMEENIDALTLHKLFYQKIHSFLPYDLILVDESSMIDAHFMLQLLKYYKPHSRLILLGDPNQLPPVGSGFVFSDLMEMSLQKSELTKCLRTDIKEIIECAEAVRCGESLDFINRLEAQKSFFNIEDKEVFYERIAKQIPKVNTADTLYEKLSIFQKFKVLSPVRKGEFGVDNINQKIKAMCSQSSCHPILIASNDYRLELFNGDMGLLINQKEAVFFARHSKESYFDAAEKVRRIPLSLLPSYELAYCISIHKSQGSEYERLSIVVPPQSEVFSRELLYTAITRAKKAFEVFSTKHTLNELIKNQNRRLSGLNVLEKK